MNDNIIIRKVKITDDFKEIAALIYNTDPYIYPYWFHDDVEEAKRVLAPLIREDGFFFNYKLMYVAIDKDVDKIIGLTCIADNKTNFDYDYTELRKASDRYEFTIDNYIMELIKEVKEYDLPYLSIVSVNPDYQGKRIGTKMLNYVLEDVKEKYKKMISNVLTENPSAVRLYEKVGFKITDEIEDIGYGPDHKVNSYSIELDFNDFENKE